jgi:hypothetical protein
MSERLFGFLDEVLQRYLGPRPGLCPTMDRPDLERLLDGDAQRRLGHARQAAAEWGVSETHGNVGIISERLLITPRGLLYAAGLRSGGGASGRLVPRPRRPLRYLATSPEMFEPIADRVDATPSRPVPAAAVDSRLGRDLVFTWPLDGALRRTLDAYQVLRLGPAGHRRLVRPE